VSDDKQQLLTHLLTLANQNNISPGTQHRDTIRGMTINHLLLQRHIDCLERRSATLQYWFIALAVAMLIQAGVKTCAPNEAPEAVEPAANLKEAPKTSPVPTTP
jgi:hypothetical protein